MTENTNLPVVPELRTIDFQVPVIKINFEQVKEGLKAVLEHYKGLVVTEDTIPTCKAEQRELASLRINLDNRRKEIKKKLEPEIKKLDVNCKELENLIIETEKPIKDGLAFYDEKRRLEKIESVEKLRDELIEKHNLIPEIAVKVQLTDQMYNVSTSDKSIRDNLVSQCINLENLQKNYLSSKKSIAEYVDTMNSINNLLSPMKVEDFGFNIDTDLHTVLGSIKIEANKRKQIEADIQKVKNEVPRVVDFILDDSFMPYPAEKKTEETLSPIEPVEVSSEELFEKLDLDFFEQVQKPVSVIIETTQDKLKSVLSLLDQNGIKYTIQ